MLAERASTVVGEPCCAGVGDRCSLALAARCSLALAARCSLAHLQLEPALGVASTQSEIVLKEDAHVAVSVHTMGIDALHVAPAPADAAHGGYAHVLVRDQVLDHHLPN